MKKLSLLILATTALAVSANAAVVLSEPFTYNDGALITQSGGLWTTTSGTTPGQVDVSGNAVNIVGTETEDVARNFSTAISGQGTLTLTLDVNFSVLPTGAGTYFLHFKDASTSGFRGRVFAETTTATAGFFQLAISNSTTTVAAVPIDLSLNTLYSLTLTYDTLAGTSTLAVGNSAAVSATDAAGTLLSITSVGLRQSTGEGTLTADNLSVDFTAAPEPSTMAGLALGSAFLIARRRRALRA